MRPKLLKSFVVVVLFWFVATTLYWSFQKPEVNLSALSSLKALLPFLPIDVPKEPSILSSLSVQKDVFMYWTMPMLALAALSAIAGAVAVWMLAARKKGERAAREKGSGNFRGVTLTLGVLPEPHQFPRDEIDLGADDNELLSRLTEKELRLLTDILGTLSAQPDAYAGEGVSTSLLEHAVNMAGKALTSKRNPGLVAIVAAAHELGKITAYKKSGDEWARVKNHDKEAARILGTLDSWNALPYLEKNAVMMAVKYHSNPRSIPDIDGDPQIHRFARELLSVADDAATEAIVEEKQKTLEKALESNELPDVLFDAFLKSLPSLSFQNRGLPKGVAAVAWKIGTRVYMLEIKLRETVMAKLPAEVRGALTPAPKERSRLQPFSLELLKALDARGWLVKKINDTKVDTKEALWNIKAGKLEFKGVIIIDVPAEYMTQLPSDDSMYEVSVSGPLFSSSSSGSMNLSKNDLLGSVLKPSSSSD